MDLQIVAPPTAQAVTLELVKQNSRVLHNQEDALIQQFIRAAQAHLTRAMNRTIMSTAYRLTVPEVGHGVQIPRPPLIEITSIKRTVEGEAEETIDPQNVEVGVCDMLPTIYFDHEGEPKAGKTVVEYTAGHLDASEVDPDIVQAIMLLASHYYTSREAAFVDPRIMNVEKKIPFGVDELIGTHRIPNVYSDLTVSGDEW